MQMYNRCDVCRTFIHITRYTLIHTLRSNGFRFFLLCSIFATLLFDGFLALQLFTRALSQSIPFCTILLFNVFVTFSGPFVIAVVINDDLRCDSVAVIFPRSFTNVVYMFGKATGIILPLLGVCVLDLIIGLIFNVVIFDDSPLSLKIYVIYSLTGALPVVIFVCGLSFLFGVTTRHTATCAIIPALILFVIDGIFGSSQHGLFDITGWHIPYTYSDFTGFADQHILVLHRLTYVLAGICMITASAVLFSIRRLCQSITTQIAMVGVSIFCFADCVFTAQRYIAHYDTMRVLRYDIQETSANAVNHTRASITGMDLDLTHDGDTITVNADMRLENRTDAVIDTCLFYLNPGLEVESVTSNGKSHDWQRTVHVITISLSTPLMPGNVDSLTIRYSGTIDDHASYADIPQVQHDRKNTLFIYNLGKRYGYVTHSYVLLTRESMWYPETVITSGQTFPASQEKNFFNLQLTARTNPGLTVLSQGVHTEQGGGVHVFRPEKKLPQFSLVIGRYERRAVVCDDVEYSLYTLRGHDAFSDYLHTLDRDDVIRQIRFVKNEIEGDLRLTYPFRRLSIIEVPVHFLAHQRYWRLSLDTVQPEQVFVHECGVMTQGYLDIKKNVRGYNVDRHDKKYQQKFLGDVFRYVFCHVSREWARLSYRESTLHSSQSLGRKTYIGAMPSFMHDYNLFPQFYCFSHDIDPDPYPLLALSIGNMIKARLHYDDYNWGMPVEMLVTKELSERNLADLCTVTDCSPFMFDIMRIKAEELSRLLEVKEGKENFRAFLSEMLQRSRASSLNMSMFIVEFENRFDVDFTHILDTWETERQFPHFVISDIERTKIRNGHDIWYQYRFIVTNTGPVAGVITLDLNAMRRVETGYRDIYLEPYQTKEIGFVDSYVWGGMYINTCNALNERRKLYRFWGDNIKYNAIPFDGERILKYCGPQETGIIVDNEDDGFTVLSEEKKMLLQAVKPDTVSEPVLLSSSVILRPPRSWQPLYNRDFYGSGHHTAHWIEAGSGDAVVSWKVELPESGEYDVFVYTQNSRTFRHPRYREDRFLVQDMDFHVYHTRGIEEVTVRADRTELGWARLGTFSFDSGQAVVELTNLSDGEIVYADAVKWLKK